jgi:hypothetical protein
MVGASRRCSRYSVNRERHPLRRACGEFDAKRVASDYDELRFDRVREFGGVTVENYRIDL